MTTNLNLRSIMETNKLTESNFLDWYRNLRIVLKSEKLLYVLEAEIPPPPAEDAPAEEHEVHRKHKEDSDAAQCIMLASMNSELQKQHEHMDAHTIILHLRELFDEQARTERYEISKQLFRSKMMEGTSVATHGLKILGLIEKLGSLGFVMDHELSVDLILQSLPDSFSQFVMNYQMNKIETTLPELINLLKTAETSIKKERNAVMLVDSSASSSKKKNVKNILKKKNSTKPKGGIKKKETATKGPCHHCGKMGHWRRNCKSYLESLKEKKEKEKFSNAPTSGMFMIEINTAFENNTWVLDTGCGSHICTKMQGLKSSKRLGKGDMDLRVGNGAKVAALAVGTYHLPLPSGLILELTNCYYVPVLLKNIISVACLDTDGFHLIFKNKCCSFSLNGVHYGNATMMNGLYVLDMNNPILNINNKRQRKDNELPSYLWHCRLGHINENRITKLHKLGNLGPFDYESFGTCESCLLGKMTKSPFTGKGERAKQLLELIHTDVCGPMSIQARGGYQYFITFIDDYSRYGYLYLMKYKSEAFEKFKEFRNEVEKQLGKSIKTLRSDRGGEYLSQEFQGYLRGHGILSQWTPPYTPQHNGVSERRNRTLLDMVRTMMAFADLPKSFWGYALETAVYILNRVPSKTVDLTPFELFYGKKPNLTYFKIWGCPAYVKRTMSDKLETKSDKCLFIGYPKESIGYSFYLPSEQKVFVSKHAVFLEKEFMHKGDSGSKIELNEVQEEQTNIDQSVDPESINRIDEPSHTQEPRRSSRIRVVPERYGFLISDHDDISIIEEDEPTTYEEVLKSSETDKWLEAMKSEMDSMYDNQVWTLVDPPEGIKPIGCKWVFKKKTDMDGKIVTYKARLVAKGYRQKQGIDYDETFSPVAMLKSIRILLALAAHYDYEIWQMDVKTAFLNGNLTEEVYMTQPEGFTSIDGTKVCKLQRSIYGLKQASRSWNIRFDETIKEFGFIQNKDEPCVYKKASGSAIVFLLLYVDDILLIGNDVSTLQSVKIWLSKNFSMKDLGEATYILGIRIYRDRSKRLLGLSQSTYIDKVLKRFSMDQSKKGFLPMSHGISLSKSMCPQTQDERDRMSKIPYASAIGSIMYAMICTRPDVSYALSITSRYQSNPGEDHWGAVKNILKYLRRTKDMFLVYGGNDLQVIGYTDASFQSDKDDCKSQSGYVFLLCGGAVSWKSFKQETTADSTTEAEYIAASEAAKEAVWIKKFITELGVVPSIVGPIPLYCDNNGAIAQAKEPRSHQRSKHVLRRYHLIREIIDRKDVKIERVPTDQNIADPLTKALSQKKHDGHVQSFGIRYMGDWL